jgi:hypothetical protein
VRIRSLDELAKAGIRAYVLGSNATLTSLAARIVLNLRDGPDAVFGMARAVHVLANHHLLVSESSDDESIGDLRDGMVTADASELAGVCRALLDDDGRRTMLAERGFELFSRRDLPATLRDVLDQREVRA